MEKIRNFCIIAHIDHGKSTIADRMMELTGTVEKREMKSQLLDSMELEREKGITIKLAPVTMKWKGYTLNLIDTPGHVDFSYEVSRSLQAVEAAVLVVDATQGIQAQTLANVYLAIEQDLTIIPVINKVDLPAAEVEKTAAEIMNLLGCSRDEIIEASGKTGFGVDKILDRIINLDSTADYSVSDTLKGARPSLRSSTEQSCRALIFDSYFDDYRGVVLYVRVFEGEIAKNAEILMMAAETKGLALEVGVLTPRMTPRESLKAGEIGYIVTNLKTTREAKVGDTVTLAKKPANAALPGYKNVLPFVYAGFFPVSNDQYKDLREAIEKLSLSDSALRFEPENSPVLGFGLRIGFLGLLHMDIIRERLEREFGLDLIVTNPSTNYEVVMNNGEVMEIKSAADLPDVSEVKEIREPWVKGEIILPKNMIGNVLNLINEKRGHQTNLSYIEDRAVIDFEAPMANLLTDFYDQLKSATSGYASFNYELNGYRTEDLVRVDFLVAGHKMDALSIMCHRSEAEAIGREVTKKLKEVIPRQNYEVALQAAIGARIIARETIGAYRKDVTVKIHTGDRDRKAKLLEKQKRGKARMKRFGKVDIPSEAFTVMLKRD
ncbi:MAG: translation elongation factor 4 [Candidatus Saccharibacteria bacterium]|uniref:Elongation factor 4 n=1 Tax=Candidatus Nanosyncoccus alces TaxID=2171997 RepID=A0ABY0FPI3_9BACT|nr:translation elongation factor 4 [Candidatus Nanosyncoccus alces]MDO4399000.1 translation elongation factor 4 [Candidatus Saccharibacteria bacterium]RYC74854.1 Elongation factor 4 [Candidatus Nanosyncoccus alces]